jgi:hypothetical protein
MDRRASPFHCQQHSRRSHLHLHLHLQPRRLTLLRCGRRENRRFSKPRSVPSGKPIAIPYRLPAAQPAIQPSARPSRQPFLFLFLFLRPTRPDNRTTLFEQTVLEAIQSRLLRRLRSLVELLLCNRNLVHRNNLPFNQRRFPPASLPSIQHSLEPHSSPSMQPPMKPSHEPTHPPIRTPCSGPIRSVHSTQTRSSEASQPTAWACSELTAKSTSICSAIQTCKCCSYMQTSRTTYETPWYAPFESADGPSKQPHGREAFPRCNQAAGP